jgi:hypothetical protein
VVSRFIPAWIHPQAAGRTLDKLTLRPGLGGSGARRITVVPQQRFSRMITGVQIAGAQAQGTVNGAGAATLSVTPQGLGTTWYPSSVVVSTSTGAADNSTASCYIGSIAAQNLQGGQSYAGGGDTIGLSVISMQPGDRIIVVWSGGVPGATAALNVTGTQDVQAYQ